MLRRTTLALAGTGVGTLAVAGTGLAAGDTSESLEAVIPVEDPVVRPASVVFFAVSPPSGVDPTTIEWDRPAEAAGGLVLADYDRLTDTASSSTSFDEEGAYEVRVRSGDDVVSWTVTVHPDAPVAPVVDSLTTDPGPDETVGAPDPLDVTASVSDSAGRLSQVVWADGRNHIVQAVGEVEGESATETLSRAETPPWIDAGYPTVCRVFTADGRVSDLETAAGPTVRQPLEVEILETNAPVAAGDVLSVTAEVTNTADMLHHGPASGEFELVVGGETVASETLSVGWNETAELTLGYQTYPVVRDVSFDVVVRGPDFSDVTTVTVRGSG